jgi:hypothetical protein
MVGLLAYRPDGAATRLLFGFERGAYDTDRLTRVLDRLESFLGGQPVTWHCCIEPDGAGEGHGSGGSSRPKGAKKDSNPSIVAMLSGI